MAPRDQGRPLGLFGGGLREAAPSTYSPTAMTSFQLTSVPGNPIGAARDFLRNFMDMRKADTIGGDKYFHCKANCEAAQRGPLGRLTAEKLSTLREIYGQRMKGEAREDMLADYAANRRGREGAERHPQRSCREICQPVRPNGLPRGY